MTEAELSIARHECGHAAMAMVLGLPVSEVRRWSPDSRALGSTYLPLEDLELGNARKWALMVLAGPSMADQPLPEWPLSRHGSTDEKLLEIFCRHLELDEQGYDELITEMWRLTCTKRFERLFSVLMTWFEHVPTLDEHILTWSMAKVMTWPEEKRGATL